MAEKKKYNFGEKEKENINGVECPVWQTPKYLEAKKKVIETLESEKYKDVLSEADFWILVNTYAIKTKAMYSGLIISHNGCLKINDILEEKLKFRPECVEIDKNGYNDTLTFIYKCPDQGIFEVGEVSSKNCKNDYPYAMALKRCMDRVILKNCKLAYSGVYSDSESDEFTENTTDGKKSNEKNNTDIDNVDYKVELEKFIAEKGLDKKTTCVKYKLSSTSKQEEFKNALLNLKVEVGE